MNLSFSFIVPVYNRPEEIQALLESIRVQTFNEPFETVIVEDGSAMDSEEIVNGFRDQLDVSYYKKANSGPGDSRNFGMNRAKGNYFIILDSDCILPPNYLLEADKSLQHDFVHCFGGPDAAHNSFSNLQKAINYSMTSMWTTGGIRGGKMTVDRFQPRSFNMGISRTAFEQVGGFGNIHPGEDPDLAIRMWNLGYRTKLIPEAFVYHKRRIQWKTFYRQVKKFGMVRPILIAWHPQTARLTYWFPTVFYIFLCLAVVAGVFGHYWPLLVYAFYFTVLFVHAWAMNKSVMIAFLSLIAVVVQFAGYGYGFLKSTIWISFSGRTPQELFPQLFFKENSIT